MKELGVRVIHAYYPKGHKHPKGHRSAPAKGRIERGFRTHQDRLIKEMRLAGIKSKDEANILVPLYPPYTLTGTSGHKRAQAGTSEFLGTYFRYREIDPKLLRRLDSDKKVTDRPRKVYVPPPDHPWRLIEWHANSLMQLNALFALESMKSAEGSEMANAHGE